MKDASAQIMSFDAVASLDQSAIKKINTALIAASVSFGNAKMNTAELQRTKMKNSLFILLAVILSCASGFLISDTGALNMTNKTAHAIKEPLLMAGEQKYYSILPAGTVLYFDRAWPEGHQTYHVYVHFKGDQG